ncbi:hypothetical protein [Sulfurimonas sp.]
MQKKEQLIQDIENLLNSYEGISPTHIDPALLEFMDEKTLIEIIGSLLDQKEELKETDRDWLEQFKVNK